MTIKVIAGDTVLTGAGVYCVLFDCTTEKLRLVNLLEGSIYEYAEDFVLRYMHNKKLRFDLRSACKTLHDNAVSSLGETGEV